jgi:hypothetical protein
MIFLITFLGSDSDDSMMHEITASDGISEKALPNGNLAY